MVCSLAPFTKNDRAISIMTTARIFDFVLSGGHSAEPPECENNTFVFPTVALCTRRATVWTWNLISGRNFRSCVDDIDTTGKETVPISDLAGTVLPVPRPSVVWKVFFSGKGEIVGLVVPAVLEKPCRVNKVPVSLQFLLAPGSSNFEVNSTVLYSPSRLRRVVLSHSGAYGVVEPHRVATTLWYLDVRYSNVTVVSEPSTIPHLLATAWTEVNTGVRQISPQELLPNLVGKRHLTVVKESPIFCRDTKWSENHCTPSLYYLSLFFMVIGFLKYLKEVVGK